MVRNNSFTVYAGQITGIFGLIGSGRTETAKIIAGVVKRDFFHGGEVRLNDRSVRYRVPRPAVMDGIVYVTEDRKIEGFFETMSIAENLHMGELSSPQSRGFVVSMSEMQALAEEWIKSAQHQGDQRQRPRDRAFRRQPAEGRDRQIAGAEAQSSSSSTSRPAASMSAPSPRSISSSTGSPTTGWRSS